MPYSRVQVFSWQMCCEPSVDSHRFMAALDAAIAEGAVPRFPAYSSWAGATARQVRPRNPLAPGKKRKQRAPAESALVAQIR